MIRRALVLVIAVGCGGGKPDKPDAAPMIDAPRAAEANCFDGVDDNGDGLADCADPTCADVATCVAEVPAGWAGYDHLFDGSGSTPSCAAPFTQTISPGGSGLTAEPASCGACSCGAPGGQTCDLPDALIVQDSTCGNLPVSFAQLAVPAAWDGTCTGDDYAPSVTTCGVNGTSPCAVSLTVAPPVVTGGACVALPGSASVGAAVFASTGVACEGAPHGSGCSGTDVCQPRPAAPFEPGVCIHHDGDVDCPAGAFTARHVFFTAIADTRQCTACTCGQPTGATCAAQISVYSTPTGCTTTPVAQVAAGDCVNLTGNPQVATRKATIAPPTGGSCAASGGAPTGAATGTGATTYCCIP